MGLQTNPVIIQLRTAARRSGLTRVLQRLLPGAGYEAAFDQALFAAIHVGDVVWDVGANVGYYTRRFAEAVGASGRVFAFEPFPTTASVLRQNLTGHDNVAVNVVALGDRDATVGMKLGHDDLAATSRIVDLSAADAEVEVLTADHVLHSGLAQCPAVVKIDTEGFELEVLGGMRELLRDPGLRAVFVEVHFGLLAERGMPNAPAAIEKLLRECGFGIRWVDPSHIAALRD